MQPDKMEFPRIIIAALRGGSGKTILSIGIIAALYRQGRAIAPFKKGPDYIDAGWLALAAGRPCYNLDAFLLSPEDNIQSFLKHSVNCHLSVIEGNRGLYDGIDLEGTTSTAELAKLIEAPVIMGVDSTKMTRTMAAVVAGCVQFDPGVMIKGVILNRVANARHEKKLRDSIEHYCGIPVIGAIPKLDTQHFPERHLGLVPTAEHDWARESIDAVTKIAQQHIDLEAVVAIANGAPGIKSRKTEDRGQKTGISANISNEGLCPTEIRVGKAAPRIGIMRDAAFQFYYPENIDALVVEGAVVQFISPLNSRTLPVLDALYIGGGFPETHAGQLAGNRSFAEQLQAMVEDGLPVYAECGGLMYLGEKLVLEGKSFPMVGSLPLVFDFYRRPQGHGYTIVSVEHENPYYAVGTEIKGHEFHYSRVSAWTGGKKELVFRMQRGVGIDKDQDGIVYKNVLATYTHIHATGTPQWARAVVRNASSYQSRKMR